MDTRMPLSHYWPGEPPREPRPLEVDGYQARSAWSQPPVVMRTHWDLSELADMVWRMAREWVDHAELARWEDDGGRVHA